MKKILFETSAEKLSRIMSSKYGVKIEFDGDTADCDGKVIKLPTSARHLPANDPTLRSTIDRLVARTKFSDNEHRPKEGMQKGLFDLFEGHRVDELLGDKYPGCKENLTRGKEEFLDSIGRDSAAATLLKEMAGETTKLRPAVKEAVALARNATNSAGVKEAVNQLMAAMKEEEGEEEKGGGKGKGEEEGEEGETLGSLDSLEDQTEPSLPECSRGTREYRSDGSFIVKVPTEHRKYDNSMGVRKLTNLLEDVLYVPQRSKFVGSKRRGALDTSRLFAAGMGSSDVFMEEEITDVEDVFVQIAVDCSGSMCGGKIETALETMALVGDSLSNLNIKFDVTGFTTDTWHDYGSAHGRTSEHKLVEWDLNPKGDEWPSQDGIRLRQNIDHESLQRIANTLYDRPNQRKILMVLSDGSPNTNARWEYSVNLDKELKDTVKVLEKEFEVIGIGIQTTAVEEFYKNCVVVNDLADLQREAGQQLVSILRKGIA